MDKETVFAAVLMVMLSLVWMGSISLVMAQSSSEWTFMVYMDADNNLDQAGVEDILEMQSVGSSSDVAVVVLFDRWYENFGRNGSVILEVQPGGNQTLWGGWSDEYEVNMGDPQTLTWFIDYAVNEFPADQYVLVLWDHGNNWEGVCWDWTSDDYLTMEEVEGALTNSSVKAIDLLGFDACLMGSVEVAYMMTTSGKVNIMIGSEDSVPWNGWPYDAILNDLIRSSWWTAHELSVAIVDEYNAFYHNIGWAKVFTTITAIDLTHFDAFLSSFQALTNELISDFSTYRNSITGAKNRADRHWFGAEYQGAFVDLSSFILHLGKTEKTLAVFIDSLADSLDKCIVHSRCCLGPHNRGECGLTIYFPRNRNSFYEPEFYYDCVSKFADATNWKNLLSTYFGS